LPFIVQIAKRIRHAPGLDRADAIWDRLRPLYHRLIGARGGGVSTLVGGCAVIRMPPEFTGGEWDRYEPEAILATVEWARAHPGGLMLDIGCSIGIFSAVALFADPSLEVIAFDPDLPSLAATLRLCRYAPGNRLRVIGALLGDHGGLGRKLDDVVRETSAELAAAGAPSGDPGTTKYICLTSPGTEAIPRYCLDQLIPADPRPLLLKCDVEGAELVVLQGARELLSRAAPDILLSVHPAALEADYGHSVADVRNFLDSAGYKQQVLAVDHEEHWWCSRR
jgi:FkbM family methyltransferase